ncbi:serine/threonine protein kinase [Persicimonas caeni]|uniref:Serine/threonine protein kinase n=1 Tax=Persicimonas caeni TaxID=2292766 RepID=A0A4Y6PZC6_PERCE|nr:serine/threonine-protein kinase [Persicimonas caeni]QDG53623.1 serine/threonine protein kinase [Persicimonas caeni]QED34844.1 serine/threonine protein kinase [Persicimonas caeni]
MSELALRPGTVVGGKYEVVDKLGAGGMGVVVEARHTHLDRRVAVKFLHAHSTDDAEFRARFDREAKVMSRLDHPNAVTVFDYGEHDGALYIVMEYLVGHPLESEVGDGPIDKRRALEIGLQICDVLTVTHEMGLVHRDIKPENIFITETDAGPHATLVDFGLAFIAKDEDLSRMTQEGRLTGTPQFLSPEQARSLPDIGPKSDIYSMGCVLYELLCGESVVEPAKLIEMLNAHVYIPATSMRIKAPDADIPAALDNFVLSMLAKEPASRPSAFEASTFLRKLLASEEMRGRGRPARLLQPRNRRAVTTAGAAKASVKPASGFDEKNPGVLGLIGEASTQLTVAAQAAGWYVRDWQSGGDFDVVVALSPEVVTRDLPEDYPTLVVVGAPSIGHAVDLLAMGVEDVAVDAAPDEILRKVQRIYDSRKRRGRS